MTWQDEDADVDMQYFREHHAISSISPKVSGAAQPKHLPEKWVGIKEEFKETLLPLPQLKPIEPNPNPRPLFNKRHYEIIGDILASIEYGAVTRPIDCFADTFAADNPNFSRERFEAYIEKRLK